MPSTPHHFFRRNPLARIWRVARNFDPPDAEPASVTERSVPLRAGALAVERRRTALSAAKRERQARLRRAASVRRAVHSEAALRVDRLSFGDSLFCRAVGVFHLSPDSALLREISRMKNLRFDFLLRKAAACGVKRPGHVGAVEVAAVSRVGMQVRRRTHLICPVWLDASTGDLRHGFEKPIRRSASGIVRPIGR